MLTLSRIDSINEADFDSLFEDSLNSMDTGTYIWAENLDTVEKKKQHIRNFIVNIHNPFMYKIMDETGKDLSLIVGKLENGKLNPMITLVGYNSNMSKSWIYYSSTATARQAFYDEMGITSIEFNYLNSTSFDTKVGIMLGNQWGTRSYDTDKDLGLVSVKTFKAEKSS